MPAHLLIFQNQVSYFKMFGFETMGLVGVKVNGVDEQSDGNTLCGTLSSGSGGQAGQPGSSSRLHMPFAV